MPRNKRKWREKRKELCLDTLQGILRAFNNILFPRHIIKVTAPTVNKISANILKYLDYRANKAGEAGSNTQRSVALLVFRGLVFLGEYCVTLKLGVEEEKVENSIKGFFRRLRSSNYETNSKTLERYRRAAI